MPPILRESAASNSITLHYIHYYILYNNLLHETPMSSLWVQTLEVQGVNRSHSISLSSSPSQSVPQTLIGKVV